VWAEPVSGFRTCPSQDDQCHGKLSTKVVYEPQCKATMTGAVDGPPGGPCWMDSRVANYVITQIGKGLSTIITYIHHAKTSYIATSGQKSFSPDSKCIVVTPDQNKTSEHKL
jgi:hypothetical protein